MFFVVVVLFFCFFTNIAFLSKLLEKIASQQFIGYLMKNKLLAEFQSAYKQFYRTEKAMGRVLNDVLWAIGTHSEAALVLLDTFSAFNTIDHTLLIDRQERSYGVGGPALSWFRSHLTEHSQVVIMRKIMSTSKMIQYGVPQGSLYTSHRLRM